MASVARMILFFTIVFGTSSVAMAGGEATARPGRVDIRSCEVDVGALLSLAPNDFDQDMFGGWRPLASRPGCASAAADLVRRYIDANWRRLGQSDLHSLYWHVGQLEALAGHVDRAIPFLLAGARPDQRGMETGFADYALGTVAFLLGDLQGLQAARARLKQTPIPSWYATEAAQVGPWPQNLSVLDLLIKCFGRPYAEAYAGECQ
jgi:hypothetical protein